MIKTGNARIAQDGMRMDMDRASPLGHEKLRVYRRGLDYVAWTHSALATITRIVAAMDHWARAAESIIENIANGNSRRSMPDRNRYFSIAIGSALECAACLDICHCRKLIGRKLRAEGRTILIEIVNMAIGLRQSRSVYVRNGTEGYGSPEEDTAGFGHERLRVYRTALQMVVWLDVFLASVNVPAGYTNRLDKEVTSMVLNIAEGNGRFSDTDQVRFLDIAHTSAMRIASCLDALVVSGQIERQSAHGGKRLLAKIVPLILGLRGYLDQEA